MKTKYYCLVDTVAGRFFPPSGKSFSHEFITGGSLVNGLSRSLLVKCQTLKGYHVLDVGISALSTDSEAFVYCLFGFKYFACASR